MATVTIEVVQSLNTNEKTNDVCRFNYDYQVRIKGEFAESIIPLKRDDRRFPISTLLLNKLFMYCQENQTVPAILTQYKYFIN